MFRRLTVFGACVALCLAAGCSSSDNGSSSTGSTGGSSGSSGSTTGSTLITLGGTAAVHPVAAGLYGAAPLPFQGTPPSVDGVNLNLEEPLLAILKDPSAELGNATLGADGEFSVPGVSTDNITLGVVGTMSNSSPDGGLGACEDAAGTPPDFCNGFVTSATGIFEGKPTADVTGTHVYGVPVAFEELLSAQLGLAAGSHLIDQGFVLGWVLDASNAPVAGVSLDASANSTQPTVRYFDDSFTAIAADAPAAQQVTNKYGLFVIVAPGSPTNYAKGFQIAGQGATYGCHKAGSNPGSVYNLIFSAAQPGTGCTAN